MIGSWPRAARCRQGSPKSARRRAALHPEG